MSQAVALTPAPAVPETWTQEQMKLITDVVAKGATPDELKLFLYRCKNMQLDPLKPGQIHFVKYGNSPGTIVVGIEGFRSKAARTGKLSGVKREVLRDEKGKCVGAMCTVYRKDWEHPAIEEVALTEYNTGKGPWAKMPETMIKKVAECAALRMAFPDDLGGLYAPEELDQAADGAGRVAPQQPEEGDGFSPPASEYRCVFGKYKGRGLEECYREFGPDNMAKQIDSVPKWLQEKGRALTPEIQEQLDRIEKFLGDKENGEGPS